MKKKPELREILHQHLPEGAVEPVASAIVEHQIGFRITRPRASKLGDFRPSLRGGIHRISVNGNLNPFSFLITFIHELAHLYVFKQYGRRVKPHGEEWKQMYRQLMQAYLELQVFPDEMKHILIRSVEKARATDSGDVELSRILKQYDPPQTQDSGFVELAQLADGSYFRIKDGRFFQKLHIRRKRFKCACIASKRLYLFSPVAGVSPASEEEMKIFLNHIRLTKSKR